MKFVGMRELALQANKEGNREVALYWATLAIMEGMSYIFEYLSHVDFGKNQAEANRVIIDQACFK